MSTIFNFYYLFKNWVMSGNYQNYRVYWLTKRLIRYGVIHMELLDWLAKKEVSGVVTHFWTLRAGDGVYLFWTKCRSVAHVFRKIDKSGGERNIFSNPVWGVFYSFYPPPLLPKSSGFLDWLRVFIMLNSFLRYLVFKVG